MSYLIKEIFYTLQGEGFNTGRPAVFCRFAGCNLWTGREEHRSRAACRFCDTDFNGTDGPGGGHFKTPEEVASAVAAAWTARLDGERFVVCTGGEPLLQLDEQLVAALHAEGFRVAIETNGTREAPDSIDWICMSPKAGTKVVLTHGDELKLVFPQRGLDPLQVAGMTFDHYFLQPMDGPMRERNIALAVEYCLQYPKWRLSLQTHKYLGIP